MSANSEARGKWVGLGGSFLHVLMTQQIWKVHQMEPFKVVGFQSFCFLLDFQNFFQEEGERTGKQGGRNKEALEGFKKVLKISKQHLWCQSRSRWMKKPRYAVKSGENALDKEAVRAKSVPQSNPIKRATCRNH